MFKILLALTLWVSLYATQKYTGCELAQYGDVKVQLDKKADFVKVKYDAIAKSGSNFKDILVGSKITLDDKKVIEIIDIRANKRVKGEPRTGSLTVSRDSKKIKMNYWYNNGHFIAYSQKNQEHLSFYFDIKAILCYTN
ncbi:hypothetical protein FJR48_05095 [Sulfurimonas lithotrophica]|uniref:Uncharacterized protein n=1 Tax=Sulfurimonas lithotrophica TaxID=2590022 RepID=A0A5P8P094_9BACT|nr:hypothetical protein [Sulfurimonas lithotrophica]QFR49135.1 hypothetical protein FJR48_05095 [Sulfurimonas lithotrophica]